jgi:rhodanese-related sulfurtransferase
MPSLLMVTMLIAACSALALAGCGPGEDSVTDAPSATYNFRDSERPLFTRTVAPGDLKSFAENGGIILDVRLAEDFTEEPTMMNRAERRDPDKIEEWATQLEAGKPVAVYCVKGKWVSQKAATYLAAHGIDVYSVEGGIEAWKATVEIPTTASIKVPDDSK